MRSSCKKEMNRSVFTPYDTYKPTPSKDRQENQTKTKTTSRPHRTTNKDPWFSGLRRTIGICVYASPHTVKKAGRESFVTYARKTSAAARPRKVATPDTRTWLALLVSLLPLLPVCWEPAAEPEPDAPEPDACALPVVVAWWPDADAEPDADDVASALSV